MTDANVVYKLELPALGSDMHLGRSTIIIWSSQIRLITMQTVPASLPPVPSRPAPALPIPSLLLFLSFLFGSSIAFSSSVFSMLILVFPSDSYFVRVFLSLDPLKFT